MRVMRSAAIRESTALLSFSLQGISNRLKATPGEAALGRIAVFINYRVLEHVSHNAEDLLGHGRAGPLGVGSLPWPDPESVAEPGPISGTTAFRKRHRAREHSAIMTNRARDAYQPCR